MIVRAPIVVTMNGAPVTDGAVRIDNDRIAQVGKISEVRATSDRTKIIDLDRFALLPGLINAHCHLDYTCLREKIPPQESFTDWIRSINAEKAKLTETDYLQSVNDGFRESLRCGTTSIVNLEAFPQLVRLFRPQPLRVWWCPELIDVTASEKTEEIIATAINSRVGEDSGGGFGLAPHALYTASAELYQRCADVAASRNFLLTTHLAESREEMQMFRYASGPMLKFLRELGRSESDCGAITPFERFLQIIRDPSTSLRCAQDDKKGRWIVAHLNELEESDFDLLEKLPVKFSIAHCPRSHAYFGHSPFPFERLHSLGFNICLATDSLASNADLSLFAEMREFQKSHNEICPDEIVQMITANAAKAIGRAADLGRIAPGYLADMIAVPLHGSTDIYQQIIAFAGEVSWVMIGGTLP